jgi:hypothetical protein
MANAAISRKLGAITNSNDKEVKMTKSLRMMAAICFVISLALVTPVLVVYAAATEYFGEDLGLGEGTKLASWPNAAAAEAEFLSHLSGVGTEDFESFAGGTTAPLSIDFGAAGNATIYGDGSISDVPSGTNGVGRYPISGAKYWEVTQTFYIEFTQPIAAFGFYGTDIGDYSGQVVVELVNGGNRTYTIPNTTNGSGGSVLFYGIIEDDPGLQFTRVNFGNTAAGTDYFGFDDFTIGTLEQVGPSPTVGGTAYPTNKLLLVLPWIGLAAIVGATSLLVLRRRRVQS